MKVLIDDIEYRPVAINPDSDKPFQLTWDHWAEADKASDPYVAIKWAWECEATAAELAAWIRATAGQDFVSDVKPSKTDKRRPLEFREKKASPALFT